ncbi:hypothetical protein [Mesorhizobium sp. WSM3864]|uniref:hypothetical protein n=1 Tax=Mesorhizobium sp. WSM3864 TaxID=2029404 RepID=UPI001140D35E|nr:hypothetical protein [Mesorhizobium sp. WSM3864]
MSQSFDANRSLVALEQEHSIVAVIKMSKAKRLKNEQGEVADWPVRSGLQAPAAEENLCRRAKIVEAAVALARRKPDGPGKRIAVARGGPPRLLAGAAAAGARYQGICDPRCQGWGVA